MEIIASIVGIAVVVCILVAACSAASSSSKADDILDKLTQIQSMLEYQDRALTKIKRRQNNRIAKITIDAQAAKAASEPISAVKKESQL